MRARPWWRRSGASILILGACLCVPCASFAAAPADPLAGRWTLDRAHSTYGPGAEPRKRESFTCERVKGVLRCSIRSERENGRRVVGSFAAPYDGKPHPAAGIPGVDAVVLRRVDAFVADATFLDHGQPVYGYRSTRSRDGRTLTIASVDPVTRAALHSVVVYRRR